MTVDLPSIAAKLNALAATMSPRQRLAALRRDLPGRIVFTTSLGLEDQAITHMIVDSRLDIALATLDTGRLFPETYVLWQETEARYGVEIRAFFPEQESVEELEIGRAHV